MKSWIPLSLALFTITCYAGSEPSNNHRANLLSILRMALEEVRIDDVPTRPRYPEAFETLDLKSLVGEEKAAIYKALGTPDNCSNESSCAVMPSWSYDFFDMPPGWRGGGWTLVLSFGTNSHCTDAHWLGNR